MRARRPPMHIFGNIWLGTLVIALLSGALGLVLGALIAAACASWYRISGFEGKAGYFMIVNALFGGLLGFGAGLLVSGTAAGLGIDGFFARLGLALALVALAGGIVTVIAFLRGDVPPRLGGRTLDLEIELRLPAGAPRPATGENAGSLTLGSSVRHVQRASCEGKLRLAETRNEDGRWIVPGEVMLFTQRGRRSLGIELGGQSVGGFIVPLPARPGTKFEAWSEWGPRGRSAAEPWPDSQSSYRFRVRRRLPPPPEPDPADVEAAAFAALVPDAPLPEWLRYLDNDPSDARIAAVMNVVARRHVEHAAAIRSGDEHVRERALSAVTRLTAMPAEVAAAVSGEQRRIVEALVGFNALAETAPEFLDVQIELRTRFSYWHRAWWTVHQLTGVDGRPPVEAIMALAGVRAAGTSMQEIVGNARAHLEGIGPRPEQQA